LLIKLLEKDPSKRLGITNGLQEIKNHQFFASIDWSKIEKK
jgi:serum/glucocorticoid-regulated kinase 2